MTARVSYPLVKAEHLLVRLASVIGKKLSFSAMPNVDIGPQRTNAYFKHKAPVMRMVSLDINFCFVFVELSGQQLL